MMCAYCNRDITATLLKWCDRRFAFDRSPKLHSPWIIEPLEPIEREY